MARKRNDTQEPNGTTPDEPNIQRPAAEVQFADELRRLALRDEDRPRPSGWKLSPQGVVAFVLGDEKFGITPKFARKSVK